jgi:hypothetical protein
MRLSLTPVLILTLAGACDSSADGGEPSDDAGARDAPHADDASPITDSHDASADLNAGEDAERDGGKRWRRNTFPGPRHKTDPGFPPNQGSDRSEWMYYFKVSPVDPTFMLTNDNMGSGFLSRDGRMFEPVDSPRHRFGTNLTFCPHDGKTAYAIQGHMGAANSGTPYSGIWRTRDRGATWKQNFDKTPLRSTDHGKTFTPFAYGGPFKEAMQIALASDGKHRGVGRAEYGFVTTRDGGLSWIGSTFATDPVLKKKTSQGSSWGAKAGWGLAYRPGDPSTLVGIYGENPPAIFLSTDGGKSWKDTGGKTGSIGCVYWHRQQPQVVYAADRRSEDGGKTWSAMNRLALAVSTSNGDVLVGNPKIGSNDLSLSLDRGETWTALPTLPQPPVSGLRLTNHVIPHAVAIDPDPARDPKKTGGKGPRILVAGRGGVYELTGDPGGSAAKGSWTVFSKGLEPSLHINDNMPYVAHVVFDPRPGFHHVVYAAKSWDPVFAAKWRGKGNRHGQARRPLYRSVDGGKSWGSLHAPGYHGIPDHLDVMDIAVGDDGTLFVDGYAGLYSLAAD